MPWRRKGVVTMAFGTRVLVIPLTAWRIYSFSTIDYRDQTLSLYYVYLTTTIQLNFAIFMSCVAFLRPFLESMVSGGMATTVQSTTTSFAKSSKLSSLFSTRSNRRASKPRPSYNMDNLSEIGLNDNSGTFGKSESNTNASHSDIPSVNNEEIHSTISVPPLTHDRNDLGPLRPDKVTNFSQVSNPPQGENYDDSAGGRDMVITRTREWEVQAEYGGGKMGGQRS
jgi:hypothetical protein